MNNTKVSGFITTILCIVFLSPFTGFCQDKPATKITIKVGQSYTVKLESFPGTGYSWTFNDPYDPQLAEYKGHAFVADPDTTKPGKPGNDEFTFKGLKEGTVKLRFAYKRNWERAVARIEDFVLIIEK